jgi:5-enolpyruvylshikimate-3-phosphate synthase
MAFAVAGLAATAAVVVEDILPVATSDPGFFGSLRKWQP